MKKFFILWCLFSINLVYSQEKIKIAVLDFYFINTSKDIAIAVYDEITVKLIDSKKFTVVERDNLNRVFQELKLQNSNEFSDTNAVEIGNYLGAQIVLFGKIQKFGSKYRVSVKGVDVKTASAVFAKMITTENEDEILDNNPLLIKQIIDEFKYLSSTDSEKEIINKSNLQKKQEMESINADIKLLQKEITDMDLKNSSFNKYKNAYLANTILWGSLFGLSTISGFISYGLLNHYIDLNSKTQQMSVADETYIISQAFWSSRLGSFIGAGVFVIPFIVCLVNYAYGFSYAKQIENKRKKIQQLEIDKQKVLSYNFDINYINDALFLSLSIKF